MKRYKGIGVTAILVMIGTGGAALPAAASPPSDPYADAIAGTTATAQFNPVRHSAHPTGMPPLLPGSPRPTWRLIWEPASAGSGT